MHPSEFNEIYEEQNPDITNTVVVFPQIRCNGTFVTANLRYNEQISQSHDSSL